MVVSEKQKEFFHIFGFLKFPGLFLGEIEEITDAFERTFTENPEDVVTWINETHDNRTRYYVSEATEKNARLAQLVEDPRVRRIVESLLGEVYKFRGSDCSIYECGTNYHCDAYGANLNYKNIKMALYLDPVGAKSGGVRYLPGSHHRGGPFFKSFSRYIQSGFSELGLNTREVPAAFMESSPGDLLLWDFRLVHATTYEGNRRRMIALDFSEVY